jgi:hypothetical protein
MDFTTDYENATNSINSIVSTQLTSALQWNNITGVLSKASTSSAGYVWGYNFNSQLFYCQLPCTGNWTQVTNMADYTTISIQDVTTDNSNVYVLYSTTVLGKTANFLAMNNANGKGNWTTIVVPFNAVNIFSTNTYIWAQDAANNKQKCAKPCTTGNWTSVTDNSVKITSASDSSLYGVDATGNAMKSDENLQTGWSPVAGLSGVKLSSLLGQADTKALYGIDTASGAYQCIGDCAEPSDLDPLNTGGYMPLSIDPDATTNSLWMTTSVSASKGNVFSRIISPDYTSIMNNITPLDQTRDKIVSQVEDEYNQNTKTMVLNKQITDVVNFFTKAFGLDPANKKKTDDDVSNYQDKIQASANQINRIQQVQPVVFIFIFALGAVAIVYMFVGPLLGSTTHTVAFLILLGAFGYSIYSSM